MTVALLVLALVVLTVGLVSATRTDNVPVSGYYPGISVSDPSLTPQYSFSKEIFSVMVKESLLLCASSLAAGLSWASLASTWWRTADLWYVFNVFELFFNGTVL